MRCKLLQLLGTMQPVRRPQLLLVLSWLFLPIPLFTFPAFPCVPFLAVVALMLLIAGTVVLWRVHYFFLFVSGVRSQLVCSVLLIFALRRVRSSPLAPRHFIFDLGRLRGPVAYWRSTVPFQSDKSVNWFGLVIAPFMVTPCY